MRRIAVKDHKGREYPSLLSLFQEYDIPPSKYYRGMREGKTLEEILTKEDRSAKDHLGNTYKTTNAMCRAYNISPGTYKGRIEKGCSVEEALTKKRLTGDYKRNVTDHKGITYNTTMDMCRAYHVANSLYRERIRRGWSVKDALEIPSKGKKKPALKKKKVSSLHTGNPWNDHLGNTYPSKSRMCLAYGITSRVFDDRLRSGWTLKDALTTEKKEVIK